MKHIDIRFTIFSIIVISFAVIFGHKQRNTYSDIRKYDIQMKLARSYSDSVTKYINYAKASNILSNMENKWLYIDTAKIYYDKAMYHLNKADTIINNLD